MELKGQSHGDSPIFSVTILINLYQSTLHTHGLLLDHQGDNIKWSFKTKTKPKLVFRDFI